MADTLVNVVQAIDYAIKGVRLLREYKKIDGNFGFSSDCAQTLLCSLKAHIIIMKCISIPPEIQSELDRALRNADRYSKKLETSLAKWEKRLGLCHNQETSQAVPTEKASSLCGDDKHSSSCIPDSKSFYQTHLQTIVQPILSRLNKAHYLALGSLSIHDTLHKLEVTDRIFDRYIPASQHLHLLHSFNKEGAEFVRIAKLRSSKTNSQTILLPTCQRSSLEKIEETEVPIFFKLKWSEGEYGGCIVERRSVRKMNGDGDGKRALEETERIALMLREDKQEEHGITSSGVGILRCCGYMKRNEDTHDLIFRPPKGSTPTTLRRILVTPEAANHPIDDRVEFAIRLASAVHVFHSLGLVHKSIRPDTILVMGSSLGSSLSDESKLYTIGTPFIAGFNSARPNESASCMQDLRLLQNSLLYHHPRQLGDNRAQKYLTSDDIYSLGVCLLEIGLWRSILQWDSQKKLYDVDRWAIRFFADVNVDDADDNPDKAYARQKQSIIKEAHDVLPTKMNNAFCKAVIACLTFGDSDKASTRDSSGPGDYADSARFMVEVICELHRAKAANLVHAVK